MKPLFKLVSNRLYVISLILCMSLMGCGGSSKSSDIGKTPPAVDKVIIDEELVDVIDQKILSKTVVQKGEVFSYQFKLGKLQQLRFIEEEYLGKVAFVDNELQYSAGDVLGTDVIRFELQQLENSNSTNSTGLANKPKIIRWMFSITGEEPRFEILQHPTINDETSAWSCIQDNDTNDGITWLVANKTNTANYAWGEWKAILPGFEAQCVATLGELGNSECNTEKLISTLNNSKVCGKNDWRLPEAYEVNNIFECVR